MPLEPGSQLGPYEVVAPLGAGGMGEVYRARDPRLGREVAIKVLPAALANDAERLARFEREARLLAAMNHPGIASIFGVESVGGAPALIMELVEGPTLADLMERGPLPPEDALSVARQMAEALEYAHERGIVHRDLKPANVKLRPDGTVKILDFGLARAMEQDALADPESALSESPTLTQRMTVAGVILGTAAYMSPEQARGKGADRRSDIFAFGAVSYEILSGRRAFAGETISDTLAAVMRDDPDWSALPTGLSRRWQRLLERCLAKAPRQRLQAIGEARIVLEDVAANPSRGEEGPALAAVRPGSRIASILPWAVAALAMAAAFALWLRTYPEPGATEFSILPSTGELLVQDSYHSMAISPDGRTLAYTVRDHGTAKLRLRRLDTREETDLAGTDGARNLFFSRSSEWIGFFDSRKMKKISVRGGTPVDLADAQQDRLGTWLDDGTIVFGPNITEPLYRIPETGGVPVAITSLDTTRRERTHRYPNALDGGPWVVFTAQTVDSPGGYDDADIDAVNVETKERRHLFKGARRAVWAPGGYLILARGSDLYSVEIDPRDPQITRDPVPVLSGIAGRTSAGSSEFCFTDDGTLAWIPGTETEQLRDVGWFDRTGRWSPTPIPAGRYVSIKVSPDGRSALIEVGPGGGAVDIWLADLASGGMNPLTHGGNGGSAAWLPGGTQFAMAKNDSAGGNEVVVRRPDGAGGERVLFSASNPINVTDVSPDGANIVVCDYGRQEGRIYLVAVDGSGTRTLAAEGDGYEMAGTLSPDGKWLAYVSNKTQREEVCVRRLDGSGGSWQLSTGGGGGIRWGRDGQELFFVSSETLHRVPIQRRGEDLVFGQPEKMFAVPPAPNEPTFRDYQYDPIQDRFCFTRPPEGSVQGREIAVSLRWTDRLASRMAGERSGR